MTVTGETRRARTSPAPSCSTRRSSGRSTGRSPTSRAIVVLHGSLAPESAIVKLGVREPGRQSAFTGPAIVFDDGAAAIEAIQDGDGQARARARRARHGLKGGPGMAGPASMVLFALDSAGLATEVAFVTDGQLSGLCLKGITVAEVSPEAAVGGPLALVENGDGITIDVDARTLDLDVDRGRAGRAGAARSACPSCRGRAAICRSTSAACSRCRPAPCWSRTTDPRTVYAPAPTA